MEYISLFVGGLFLFGLISFLKTALHVTKQVAQYRTAFFIKALIVSMSSAGIGAYFGVVEIKLLVTGCIGFLVYVLYELITWRH